jgi:hypothetical protein
LFNIASLADNPSHREAFFDLICSRIRISDEIGWFNSVHVGVLLPDTKVNGAHKLAKSVLSKMKIDASTVPYNVYSYPSTGEISEDDRIYPVVTAR